VCSSDLNHTVTHLLNESLRVVLGPHVQQHGSYVGSEGLRFDFNNYSQPTNEEILKIEELVNSEINKAVDVKISYHPLEEARKMKDRKSTRLNSSHVKISYAVFCLKKKKKQ